MQDDTAQDTAPIPVHACRYCPVPYRNPRGHAVHYQRWADLPVGWHSWTAPTQEQIKERMIARRAARIVAAQAAAEEAAKAVMVEAARTALLAAAKDTAAAMHAASQVLRRDPCAAGVSSDLGELFAGWLYGAAEDLAGARRHAKTYGGDPFEHVDEPASVRFAARIARQINRRKP